MVHDHDVFVFVFVGGWILAVVEHYY
jgi:hypothetical protein